MRRASAEHPGARLSTPPGSSSGRGGEGRGHGQWRLGWRYFPACKPAGPAMDPADPEQAAVLAFTSDVTALTATDTSGFPSPSTGARWSFGEATTHCDLCSVPRGARERYVKERFWFRCVSIFRMIGVSPSVVPGNAAEPRAGPRACREPSPCYCIAVVVTDDDQDALSPPGAGGGPNAR